MDDLVRSAIIALSAGLLFVVNKRVVRDWHQWNNREKVVRVHLNALLACIAYGTTEAMAQHVEFGFRVLLVLATLVSFAICLFLTRNDPPTSRYRTTGVNR